MQCYDGAIVHTWQTYVNMYTYNTYVRIRGLSLQYKKEYVALDYS